MLFRTLDGYEVNKDIKFSKYALKSEDECKSHAQYGLGQILSSLFPNYSVLEEFPIQVQTGKTLSLDFFIPQKNIGFECHGRQHYEFVEFFHGNKRGFQQSQVNDKLKEDWCILNTIDLFSMPDNNISLETIKNILSFS